MIYITYPSAPDYWLNGTSQRYPGQQFIRIDFTEAPEEDPAAVLAPVHLPEPVSVAVADRSHQWTNKHIAYRVLPKHLPGKSFVLIGRSIAVMSPECCFLAAATHLPFERLVEFGNRLCAKYVYDGTQPYGQRSRNPITAPEMIRAYLDSAPPWCLGRAAAISAARYIQAGSNSPMEDKLAAYLSLSIARGGCGVKQGELNGRITLSEEALRYNGNHICLVDILWESDKTALEYDSSMSHGNEYQRQLDCQRQTMLNQSGYKVVRLTAEDIRDFDRLDNAVMLLRDNLKMKKRTQELQKYSAARKQVWHNLFRTADSFFKTVE